MEDSLSQRDFTRLAAIIETEVGIKLPAAKRTMVEGRLRKRVKQLGLGGVDEYCQVLFEGNGLQSEFIHLVDLITTNKTDFFREPNHFDLLREKIVPHFLSRPRMMEKLKFWSAAASVGAEAYSLAMLLSDMALDHPNLRFSILGTDISTEVLREAVRAVYPEAMAAPIPPEMRRRYLMTSRDPAQGQVRIVPELRQLVRFQRLNLMDGNYPADRDMHVIFCRNVLIYFDKPTQQAVLERLCSHLRPGGYLFVGHSESGAAGHLPGMTPVVTTVFCRQ